MELRIVHDSKTAYEFLINKTRYDYIYQYNNLAAEQWKNVVCFGLFDNGELKQMAMLNINYRIPVLLVAGFDEVEYSIELLSRIKNFLPSGFYAHIDKPVLHEVFPENCINDEEEYMNMGLCSYDEKVTKKYNDIVRLGYTDITSIKELISVSYPEAWLDEELVKLNENFGAFVDGKLVSFAGIHAYSEEYQVAAVAHVTTHPDFRGRGYAESVVAELLKSLTPKIRYIGLNVKVSNAAAINCYKKLGFEEYGKFTACEIEISADRRE